MLFLVAKTVKKLSVLLPHSEVLVLPIKIYTYNTLPKLRVLFMVYIDIKVINGREYKYLRKTVWTGEKYIHLNLRCLGAVDPIYKTMKKQRKSNASIYLNFP